MANERINFNYDPTRQGYDTTLWKTITGVPAINAGAIRVNTAKIIGYADIFKEDLTMNVNILSVVVPTIDYINMVGAGFIPGDTITNTTTGETVGIVLTDTGLLMTLKTITGILTAGDIIDNGTGTTAEISSIEAFEKYWGLEQINVGSKIVFAISNYGLFAICTHKGITSKTPIAWDAAWTVTNVDYTIKWTGFSADFIINGARYAFTNDLSVPKVSLSMMVENLNADDMDVFYVEDQNVQGYI